MLLKNLIELSRQFDAEKVDTTGPVKAFRFDPSGRIVAPRDPSLTLLRGAPLSGEMTRHAFRQLCSKLGPVVYGKGSDRTLPADYLLTMPADQMAYNMNRHVTGADPKRSWLDIVSTETAAAPFWAKITQAPSMWKACSRTRLT
jgi:hypothetical protein